MSVRLAFWLWKVIRWILGYRVLFNDFILSSPEVALRELDNRKFHFQKQFKREVELLNIHSSEVKLRNNFSFRLR